MKKNRLKKSNQYLHLLLGLIAFGIFISPVVAQNTGCTDPRALNYDPDAQSNDGSCIYESTSYNPDIFIDKLPDKLNESSGLVISEEGVWTHNDSGGEPAIYLLDFKSGEIIKTVRIKNAKNVDWEDITQDDEYIYISDAGNNAGKRKELQVYKIKRSDIDKKRETEVEAGLISYSYLDQESFSFNPMAHNFDCEAILAFGDSLYLFSKNWGDLHTRLYVLPKMEGHYEISPRDQYNVDGLITGASVSHDQSEITLVGYKDFESFIILLYDFEGDQFFSGNKRKINFPELLVVQTEGIDYMNDRKEVLISCEESSVPPRIYRVNAGLWTSRKKYEYQPSEDFSILVKHDEENMKYTFEITRLPDPLLKFEIYDKRWRRKSSDDVKVRSEETLVTLSFEYKKYDPGIYFVKFISGDKYTVRRIRIE